MRVVARAATSLVTAIVLVASCGTTSSSTTTDSVSSSASGLVEISVTAGLDSGADRIVQIPLGVSVRVTLTNLDAADEYHLHGYDIDSGEVLAGESAIIEFDAITAGSFEIESHASEQVLIVLEIS